MPAASFSRRHARALIIPAHTVMPSRLQWFAAHAREPSDENTRYLHVGIVMPWHGRILLTAASFETRRRSSGLSLCLCYEAFMAAAPKVAIEPGEPRVPRLRRAAFISPARRNECYVNTAAGELSFGITFPVKFERAGSIRPRSGIRYFDDWHATAHAYAPSRRACRRLASRE